jgi:hypothetical protein
MTYKIITEKMLDQKAESHKEFFDTAYRSLNIVFPHEYQRRDSDREIIMFFFEEQNFDIDEAVRVGDIIAAKVELMRRRYADWDFEITRQIIADTYKVS